MALSKAQLARQLRGHLELLAAGGVRELPVATRSQPTRKPAPKRQAPPRMAAPAVPTAGFKAVVVPSCALAELNTFQGDAARTLEPLAEQVRVCARCRLCETRTQTVFGTGNPRSPLMIVGEAPGGDEDTKGVPFVGRAGKLLTDIIEKGMKYRREHVYIANVLKCRPPNNRNPEQDEIDACRGYLQQQIDLINPKVILAVGLFPAQWLTGQKLPIGKLRGQVYEVNGRKVIATYHPAYLLRNYTVETRKKVHEDVLLAVGILGSGPLINE